MVKISINVCLGGVFCFVLFLFVFFQQAIFWGQLRYFSYRDATKYMWNNNFDFNHAFYLSDEKSFKTSAKILRRLIVCCVYV